MSEIIELNQPVMTEDAKIILPKQDQEGLVRRSKELIEELYGNLENRAYISLPVTQLSTLGAGVASLLPEFLQIVEGKLGSETLYRVANAAVGDTLKMAKNGNFWGAMKTADGVSKMAQLQAVGCVENAAKCVATVNPAVLMVAIALFSVEKQIGKISEMQKQIISFLEVEKEAEIEADLQTLGNILTNFKYSWDNDYYVKNNHKLVLDIRRTAEKNLIAYQKKVDETLLNERRIVRQAKVGSTLQELLRRFQYYRMSLFVDSMASLLDVMLSGNFKEEYISGIKAEITKAAVEYRERFTKCSDYLERLSKSSVQKQIIKGLGSTGVAVGKIVEKIPLVEKGSVDEYLQKAGMSLKEDAEEMVERAIQKFSQVRDPGTGVFVDKLEDLIQIYNHTKEICFDGEQLHLIAS